jgi:hypothetical protein
MPITRFERRQQPILTPRQFIGRMARAIWVWAGLTLAGLTIGMAGYAVTEDMGPADAFVNAAMILSGMGPVQELHTNAGKIFAGFYAILSGLIIVIATSFVLAPIFHRVLHAFHVESRRENEDN